MRTFDGAKSYSGIVSRTIQPDENNNWLVWSEKKDFATFAAVASRAEKGSASWTDRLCLSSTPSAS